MNSSTNIRCVNNIDFSASGMHVHSMLYDLFFMKQWNRKVGCFMKQVFFTLVGGNIL